jgi:hypothetical protein
MQEREQEQMHKRAVPTHPQQQSISCCLNQPLQLSLCYPPNSVMDASPPAHRTIGVVVVDLALPSLHILRTSLDHGHHPKTSPSYEYCSLPGEHF